MALNLWWNPCPSYFFFNEIPRELEGLNIFGGPAGKRLAQEALQHFAFAFGEYTSIESIGSFFSTSEGSSSHYPLSSISSGRLGSMSESVSSGARGSMFQGSAQSFGSVAGELSHQGSLHSFNSMCGEALYQPGEMTQSLLPEASCSRISQISLREHTPEFSRGMPRVGAIEPINKTDLEKTSLLISKYCGAV